jgi:hypothetical protein
MTASELSRDIIKHSIFVQCVDPEQASVEIEGAQKVYRGVKSFLLFSENDFRLAEQAITTLFQEENSCPEMRQLTSNGKQLLAVPLEGFSGSTEEDKTIRDGIRDQYPENKVFRSASESGGIRFLNNGELQANHCLNEAIRQLGRSKELAR